MRLITRTDLETWALGFDSKGGFPILLSKLVRATTSRNTKIDFPSGSAAFIGGWDGIVSCEENTPYVPSGISLWELGTEASVKKKADSDYKKRTLDTLGYSPKDSVFIFVTLRSWAGKDNWAQSKRQEGKWRDVFAYDSSDLEQWLAESITASRWFAAQIGKYPLDGMQLAEEYWEEWASGPPGWLLPEVIASGRELEQRLLLDVLQGPATIKAVRASTKNEAVAFIIAAAKLFPADASDLFFSKTLIVDTVANYRGIRINNTTPLNLIPRFDETQALFAAVSAGHHVLVPLGADDSFNLEPIVLPTIDRNGQVKSLIDMGLSTEDAEKYSRESGRNVTILRKLLEFPSNAAKWLKSQDLLEIIPALLIGKWDEKFVGDIELVEKVSGLKYDDYLQTLQKWKSFEESPILQIGDTWRLTSPLDLWTNIAPYIKQNHVEKLRQCFELAFENGNPFIEIDDPDNFIAQFNRQRKFSRWAREGVIQSLIMIARFGDSLKVAGLTEAQYWVDDLIESLLYNADGEMWVSVDHELPLIAEASPDSFLKAVTQSLNTAPPPIMEMFKETDGFLHAASNHTGLLWALEGLAWIPEYLHDTSLILLKLARLDPGGNLSNRPINSIIEIYKTRHFQTLASFEERMGVLDNIVIREPNGGWNLLVSMLPEHRGIAQPTHKMRWRVFDQNLNIDNRYTWEEIFKTHSRVLSLLLDIYENTEKKFLQLIRRSVELSPVDRNTLLSFLTEQASSLEQNDYSAADEIRDILSRHRSFPETDWALPESELIKYDLILDVLSPKEGVEQYLWLFNNPWPRFPEGGERHTPEQGERIHQRRVAALLDIYEKYGLDAILNWSDQLKDPYFLGQTLAHIPLNVDEILSIANLMLAEEPNSRFLQAFFESKTHVEGYQWFFGLYNALKVNDYPNRQLATLLTWVRATEELWDFIDQENNAEVKNIYWQTVDPNFYLGKEGKKIAIERLLSYKRYWAVLSIISLYPEEIDSSQIVNALTHAATEQSADSPMTNRYDIIRMFEEIDKRSDIAEKELVRLEWLYISALASYSSMRPPKTLHNALSTTPSFFVEVLKWLYKGNETETERETGGTEHLTAEQQVNRARSVYDLLQSWKKIPGINDDYSINAEALNNWIKDARALAHEANRIEIADMRIGELLAQYPEKKDSVHYPPDEISEVIERLNTKALIDGYYTALINKRGSSSRGPYDGGRRERNIAKYFRSLASDRRPKYPTVAKTLTKIAERFDKEAIREDEEAERNRLEY